MEKKNMIVVGVFATSEEISEIEYIRQVCLVGNRARSLAGENRGE